MPPRRDAGLARHAPRWGGRCSRGGPAARDGRGDEDGKYPPRRKIGHGEGRQCRAGRQPGGRCGDFGDGINFVIRSEEHTSELQSLMRISYADFCVKKINSILVNIMLLLEQLTPAK